MCSPSHLHLGHKDCSVHSLILMVACSRSFDHPGIDPVNVLYHRFRNEISGLSRTTSLFHGERWTSMSMPRERRIELVRQTETPIDPEPVCDHSPYPRYPPGNYQARCVAVRVYRDPRFKRWTCRLEFRLITGARRGEIRGMFWENYRGGVIQIARSVWNGHVTDPKNAKSKGAIPIISHLASKLNAYRARQGNPISGPMFPNDAGKPMDLNNLLNRVILPALDVCAVCRVSRSNHSEADHDFKRDHLVPYWHGWHAFRRGLGTNLHRLGVPDKTIQAILRHANVSTTQTFYIKTVSEDSVAAMEKLDIALNDTVVTPVPASPASTSVN